MSVGKYLKNTGWAALAAAMAVTALPAEAFAQDRGARSERRGDGNSAGERRGERVQQRLEQRAARIDRRTEQRAARIDNRSEQRAARVEQRGDRAAAQAARQGNWGQARRIDRQSEQAARQIEQRGDWRARQVERRGDQRADQIQRRDGRNGTYTDLSRNRAYVDNTPRGDNDRWRDNDRRDGSRWSGSDRRDDRRWDRRWRDNSRYDWQRYRNTNRIVFRLGTYYSPYRNYSYRRFSIGSRLDSLFFGSRYWINDPWQYRLPEVYGPYRWVRYYDDVLLVDIYSGQVVDVIYDFFW